MGFFETEKTAAKNREYDLKRKIEELRDEVKDLALASIMYRKTIKDLMSEKNKTYTMNKGDK